MELNTFAYCKNRVIFALRMRKTFSNSGQVVGYYLKNKINDWLQFDRNFVSNKIEATLEALVTGNLVSGQLYVWPP